VEVDEPVATHPEHVLHPRVLTPNFRFRGQRCPLVELRWWLMSLF
jgi:hypothetical protein